jgi:energy-coupling factor transporter transmembrane protein EcfT
MVGFVCFVDAFVYGVVLCFVLCVVVGVCLATTFLVAFFGSVLVVLAASV